MGIPDGLFKSLRHNIGTLRARRSRSKGEGTAEGHHLCCLEKMAICPELVLEQDIAAPLMEITKQAAQISIGGRV
jgi:hypothetical protein